MKTVKVNLSDKACNFIEKIALDNNCTKNNALEYVISLVEEMQSSMVPGDSIYIGSGQDSLRAKIRFDGKKFG